MKKSTRLLKRFAALLLVVLMSIESFSAVVSGDDGAAFVTKSEFESLKDNFEEQLERYSDSIDNKVDGAIASYIAGSDLSKRITYDVEIRDWEQVTCVNHVLEEQWTLPDFNMGFAYTYNSYNPSGNWWDVWWGLANFKYERPLSDKQKRNVINAGPESPSSTYPDEVTWVGQATDYREELVGNKIGVCPSVYGTGSHAYSYLWGQSTGEMAVTHALEILSGYHPARAVSSTWSGGVFWYGSNASYRYDLMPTNWVNQNITTTTALNYVDKKQYNYEHILSWDSYNWSQLSDPNWSHTLGNNPKFTQAGALSNTSVVKKGNWGAFEIQDTWQTLGNWVVKTYTFPMASGTAAGTITHRPTSKDITQFYTGGYGESVTTAMQSVGVLNTTYTSKEIYQWDKDKKMSRDENVKVKPLNLCEGLLIGYGKFDETFEWEPVISGTYKVSADATTSTKVPKWRVKLSTSPFTTKDSLKDSKAVLKNKDQSTDYLETDANGKCKFKIEKLANDSVIYCKWWPADTTICNNYIWEGSLDLTKCGSYIITEAS